ncbi:hypothetical protein PMIN06_003868 [Paraphaeosphaeria minitans]
MEDVEDKNTAPRALFESVKDISLAPFRIATSPPLLRTYLRTLLILLTSSLLFAAAVVAYTSFYYAYIPIRGLHVPVYLQYEHSPIDLRNPKQPYGIANIEGLVSRQKYDVEVTMVLPRSENNLAAGNWMVGLDMRGPGTRSPGIKSLLGWEDEWEVEDNSQGPNSGTAKEGISPDEAAQAALRIKEVLARSRRPAILTYRSWLTEMCYRALRLPLYVVGWGTESETVSVMVMEGVQFEKGWKNVPASIRLELRSRIPLEVYRASVRFVAKLEGLRWVMYTHRLISAAVFIGVFWGVEMGVLLFTWALFAFCLGTVDDENATQGGEMKTERSIVTPKTEPADSEPPTPMSDTDRVFPTLSTQQPLRYSSSSPKEGRVTPALADIPTMEEAEADDEEDDFLLEEPIPNSAAGVLTDSGIGTSMDSSVERKGLNRRKSQRDR